MPSNWERIKYENSEGEPHGFGSNSEWTLIKQTAQSIAIQCLYPEQSPVQKLIRVVRPDPNSPKVDFELQVIVKRDVNLPIGLHPVLDTSGGSVILKPGKFNFGMTFPGLLEPSSITTPGALFSLLQQVPVTKGGKNGLADFSRLPRVENTENLLQLCGIDGSFDALVTTSSKQEHKEKGTEKPYQFTTKFRWDASHFPSVILWQSNKGRPAYPWSERFLGCGIEPVCAAFDLGTRVSSQSNPINQRGVPTAVLFKQNQAWTTKYSIEVSLHDSKL